MFRRQRSRSQSARSKSPSFSFASFFSGRTRCSAERALAMRHGLSRRLFVEELEDRRMLAVFSNLGAITIPAGAPGTTNGPANPYPSVINVPPPFFPGVQAQITDLNVTLSTLSHGFPDDIDVLLVGPTGINAIIMSDVGGSDDAAGITLTLDDQAATSLPDGTALAAGTFKPTNIGAGDVFDAPAPAPSGGSVLNVFNGTDATGAWRLFVMDDLAGDTGAFAGGWSLNIQFGGNVIIDAGSDADNGTPDTFHITRTGAGGANLEIRVNGVLVFNELHAGVNNVTFVGSSDDDHLTVDTSGGLITIPGDIRFNGGQGFDSVRMEQLGSAQEQTSATYSIGVAPGSGTHVIVGPSGTQTLDFENIEPFVDVIPNATIIVDATPEANAINYSQAGVAANGLVTVDNYGSIEFSNKVNLTINGLAGSDEINLNNPSTPTNLTNITVNGDDPTASDVLIVNGTAATETITYSPTAANSGTVTVTGLPDIAFTTVEHLTVNGQGGDDSLVIDTVPTDGTMVLTPGSALDAGTVEFATTAPVIGVPLAFLGLGAAGSLAFADIGRFDNLHYLGTELDDTFSVNAAGQVTLNNRIAVNTASIITLTLAGLDGDDTFNIAGNHNLTGIVVEGGDPSASDVLNLTGAAATAESVVIAPNGTNTTMQDVTGLGGAMLVSGVELIKYTGAGGDDSLRVELGDGVAVARVESATPTGTDRVISSALPIVQFSGVLNFELDGSAGATSGTFVLDDLGGATNYTFDSDNANDTLIIEGNGGADSITVDMNGANPRITSADATINTTDLTATDLLKIHSLGGDDSLTVNVNGTALVPTPIEFDGGLGRDTLTVTGAPTTAIDEVIYTPGLQPDEGRLLYENAGNTRLMSIDFDNIEPVIDTTVATTLTINGNGSANSMTAVQDPAAATRVLASVDGFETMSFNNKTAFTLNGLDGDDTIVVDIATAALITGLVSLRVNGNEGHDEIRLESLPTVAAFTTARADGGAGNDVIDASLIPLAVTTLLTLNGDAGNDEITGGAGVDTINGGTGDDTLIDSPGADIYSGNGGIDTLVVRGTAINDILSVVQNAPSAVVGANYTVNIINGLLAVPPAAAVDQITTTNAALAPNNAANLPTVERIRVEGLAGDDGFTIAHNDAYSDLSNANGLAAQTIPIHIVGDAPNASDRLVVQDNGIGDLVIHREGPDGRSGSIVVGGMAPITYETTERVDIIPLDNAGQTGTPAGGRLLVFKHDDFETNESATNATPLGLEPVFIGQRNIEPGLTTLPPFGAIPGDEDWYEFRPTIAGAFRFDIFFEHIETLPSGRPGLPEDGDLRLDVFRANGTLIASSNTSGTTPINVDSRESVTVALNPDVTESVFIRVKGAILANPADVESPSAAINVYDIAATEADDEGPQVFDPDNGGPLAAIFPNNLPNYNLFDPKPVLDGPSPLIHSLTVNIRDLPTGLPGDPLPALDAVAAAQLGLYSVIGDHVGNIDIISVDVFNANFNGTVSAAANALTFTANPLAQPPSVGDTIIFNNGPAAGVARQITAIVGNQITVNLAFPGIPAAGDSFTITTNNLGLLPGEAFVVLNFDRPLPDDRFTLRILDGVVDPGGNELDGESDADEPGTPSFPSGNGFPGGDFEARFTVDTRPEIGAAVAADIDVDINGNYHWDPNNEQIGNDHTNVDLSFTLLVQNGVNGPLAPGGFNVNDLLFAGKFTNGGVLPPRLFDQMAAFGYSAELGDYRWLIDTTGDGVITIGSSDLLIELTGGTSPVVLGINVAGAIPIAGNFNNNAADGDEIGLFISGRWLLDTNHDFVLDTLLAGTNMLGAPVVGDFDGDGDDDLAVFNSNVFFFDLNRNGTTDTQLGAPWGFPGVLDKPIAADMDQDGIDDIGLWAPRNSASVPREISEWYFLVSGSATAAVTVFNVAPAGASFTLTAPGLADDIDAGDVAVGQIVRIVGGVNAGQAIGTVASVAAGGVIVVNPGTLNPGIITPAVGDIIAVGGVQNSIVTLNHAFNTSPFGNDIAAEFGDELALPIVGNFDPPVAPTYIAPAPAGVDGDFTGDSMVDGADFLSWQRNVASQTTSQNADDLADWQDNFGAVAAAAASGSMAASETVVFAAPAVDEPAAAAVDEPATSLEALQVDALESAATDLAPARVGDANLDFVMLVGRSSVRASQKADAPARDSARFHSRDAVLSNWNRRTLDRYENGGDSYFDDDWKIAVRGGKADARRATPEELEELVFAEF